MKRAEDLVREALSRQRENEGMRIRVRLSKELKLRAERCAREVGDDLMRWAYLACKNMTNGMFEDVAWGDNVQSATRDGSEVVWVRAPARMNPKRVRMAIGCAVVYAEERRRPAFETAM